MRKVRVTIFYENRIIHRTLKEGDPVHLPGYFASYNGEDGLPRSIMLEKLRTRRCGKQ